VVDQADMKHWKSLIRTIKYVKKTKDYIIKIFNLKKKEEDAIMEVFSYSDHSVDKETRRSVTGYVFFYGSPISWKLKSQKNVTLSTTESEYVAMSEAVRELKFVYQVLQALNEKVISLIKVNVDNVGAIFLTNKRNASKRTKYVDVWYHFVREMIDKNFLEITFVRTDENIADIFIKI
jgi:hypothetical protein